MGIGPEEPGGDLASALGALVADVDGGRGRVLFVESDGPPPSVPVGADPPVIRVRGRAEERLLAYAGLSELCEPLAALIDRLPPRQRDAVRGAVALGPPRGDSLAVAAGVRSLVHLAAETSPMVVLVEDAHDLDRGTAEVVSYLARRVGPVPVGLIITQDATSPGRLTAEPGATITVPPRAGPPTVSHDPAALAAALGRAEARGSAADLAAAADAIAARGSARGSDGSIGPEGAALLAANAWLEAGHPARARERVELLWTSSEQPAVRAGAALLLGRLDALEGRGGDSARHLRSAVELAAGHEPAIAAEARLLLLSRAIFGGRTAEAVELLAEARADVRALAPDGGHPLAALLAGAEAALAVATGSTLDVGRVISELESVRTSRVVVADLSLLVSNLALPMIWAERLDEAVDLLDRLVAAVRSRNAVGAIAMPLCALSIAHRRAGRASRAMICATEARDVALQTGDRQSWLFAQSELANTHALLGDLERCRAAAMAVLASGTRGTFRTSAVSALATLELWAGDPAAVIELLEPMVDVEGGLSQSVTLFHHTLISAYAMAGRFEAAEPLLDAIRRSVPADDGRMQAVLLRSEAVLAPAEERDRAFARAIGAAEGQTVNHGLTRLMYARRLLADGAQDQAVAVLRELASETDENLLGVARAARLALARRGVALPAADPGWAQLDPTHLEVALATVDATPVLELADRLRLSPPEVVRMQDAVRVAVGARSSEDLADVMGAAGRARVPRRASSYEIDLLGGLEVRRAGQAVPVPGGSVATTLAVLALRRAVHMEELTTILWPDASPSVARRRLRNVLARVRSSVGPVVERRQEAIHLVPGVEVDETRVDSQARWALAMDASPEKVAALAELVDDDTGTLLPEALYDDWVEEHRHRVEVRRASVAAALEATRRALGR